MGFLPAPCHTTDAVGPELLTNAQSPAKRGEVCGSALFRLGCDARAARGGSRQEQPLSLGSSQARPGHCLPSPSDTNYLYLTAISVAGAPVQVNGSILRRDVTISSVSKIQKFSAACPCVALGRREVDGDREATFASF